MQKGTTVRKKRLHTGIRLLAVLMVLALLCLDREAVSGSAKLDLRQALESRYGPGVLQPASALPDDGAGNRHNGSRRAVDGADDDLHHAGAQNRSPALAAQLHRNSRALSLQRAL